VHKGRVLSFSHFVSGGSILSPPPKKPYTKQWLSYSDQVSQLVSRGLVVPDPLAAAKLLSHISYYRFSGFCLAFESARHTFVAGTTFQDVVEAYQFDCDLRELLTDAVEMVEIDLRTATAYQFGKTRGVFGHRNQANFFGFNGHPEWLEKLREEARRSSELFITHFRNTYTEFPDLPIWVAVEIMSFGNLSRMFSALQRVDQAAIAKRYGLQVTDLGPIIHHLVYIRNLCAHHSRIWDRVWAIKPSLPRGQYWQPPHITGNDRVYSTALLAYHLMKCCPDKSPVVIRWRDRLHVLFTNPPKAVGAEAKLGLVSGWKTNPLWK